MYVKFLGIKGTWREVANSANTTIEKGEGDKEPSSKWKRKMLLCEHSPIRQLVIKAKWYDLQYWVSVHLVRHWLGIIHWVRSQRDDRTTSINQTHVNRGEAKQNSLIEHEVEANAQAIINISRRRLCNCASKETREAWQAYIESFKDIEPEMYEVCVPDCVYRGWCFEFKSCGFHKTDQFIRALAKYRNSVNDTDQFIRALAKYRNSVNDYKEVL